MKFGRENLQARHLTPPREVFPHRENSNKPIARSSRKIKRKYTDSRNSLSPTQANSQDRTSCLPCTQVDSICGPIRHPRPDRPGLILDLHGIHILICPDMLRSQRRFLFWQFPRRSRGTALLELLPGRDIAHGGDVLHGREYRVFSGRTHRKNEKRSEEDETLELKS